MHVAVGNNQSALMLLELASDNYVWKIGDVQHGVA